MILLVDFSIVFNMFSCTVSHAGFSRFPVIIMHTLGWGDLVSETRNWWIYTSTFLLIYILESTYCIRPVWLSWGATGPQGTVKAHSEAVLGDF